MDSYTIFIFEGHKTEVQIFNRLKELYLENISNQIAICSFRTHLYTLHKSLTDDPDLSLFSLLKRNSKNSAIADILESQVSEIYMFFDYDGHVPGFTFEKIEELLETFDNETEQGKLYISYPMAESFKHLNPNISFRDSVAKSEKLYKEIVNSEQDHSYPNLRHYTKDQWGNKIKAHCKKLNFIMNKQYSPPEKYFPQIDIYLKQKEDYISPTGKVAVLSAFPIFLIDYFGTNKYEELTT